MVFVMQFDVWLPDQIIAYVFSMCRFMTFTFVDSSGPRPCIAVSMMSFYVLSSVIASMVLFVVKSGAVLSFIYCDPASWVMTL